MQTAILEVSERSCSTYLMKILQISTSLTGGAGIAALRSHYSLLSAGADSTLVSLSKGISAPNSSLRTEHLVRISPEKFMSFLLTRAQRSLIQNGPYLQTPLSLGISPRRLQIDKYDLIHIHSMYNLINDSTLSRILEANIPAREARIGFCRNAYLAQLRDNPKYKEVEYLVVADWDGINSELDPVAIESCLQVSGWDGCFANQYRYYYDIYALRHPVWSPNDCWKYESFLRSIGLSHIEAREKAVYSRQKHIPSNSPWIPVHSAFGGLAIYRVSSIKLASYQGYEQDGSLTCEHVSFNLEILRTGGKLFINPSLINSHGNPHTLNRSRINRLKWNIKRGLVKVFKFYAHKSI